MADVIKIYQRLKQDLTQLVAWVRANYLGKVQNPTAGHFAGVDSTGNVVDSGYGSSSFQTPLSSQTAYNRKGSASAVPQITTNALGQVTAITEVPIEIPASQVQTDWQENDATSVRHIQNRTHYVESVSTSDVWYQSNVEVGSASSSPGAYSGTFNLTEGKTYNVTISQGSNTKTYEGIVCENNTTVRGLFLNKNWSNPMQGAEAQSDAFYILVQASSVILASVDVYGSGCTVQVSEVTETIHKLDPKYLPDNVNQLEDITTSKSGKVTTVTFEQTNGTETQFQVTDGEDGKSAYQVAVDNGYSGTEAQWLASLKGADGVSLGEVELTQEVTTATDSVPANKAVYDKVQRVDIENANKSDYNDNQWLQDQGWKLNYRLFQNFEIAASGYCISPMFPFVYGHTYTFSYQFNTNNNCTFSFFTDDGVYKEYYSCNANNVRTVTASVSSLSSCTQMRGTFSLSNIRQCYIHDDTTNEYIFKGDEYLDSLTAESDKEFDNLIDYKTYINELLVQKLNQSTTQAPSAKAVQDSIEVWRDDANIIYKADNIVLDGTNYVDTGIQLLAEDIDWTIEMVVTDVANSYTTYDMLLSCMTNASYGFRVYKVAANLIRMTPYNGSSGNVNINVGTGSVNRITVTKVGRTYTLTCNGVSVSLSENFSTMTTTNPLIIGANVDYGNKGRFTLQSIRIYQSIPILQQYTDHTKTLPFYPITSTDGVIGLEKYVKEAGSFSGTFSKYSIADFQELNPASCNEWSFLWDKRYQGIHGSFNDLFVISSNDGANSFTLRTNGNEIRFLQKKNGTETSTRIKVFDTEYQHIIFTFNLVTGAYVGYGNGVQYASGTLDTTKFPDLSTLETVTIANNDANGQKYFAVFNCILLQTEVEEILAIYPQRALPMKFEATKFNYNNEDLSSAKATGTNVSYSDRTSNSIKVTTSVAVGDISYVAKDNIFNVTKMKTNVHICKMHINVLSGGLNVVSLGVGAANLDVYDNQGNYIGTGTGAGTLGSGEYDLIFRGQFGSSYNENYNNFILRFSTSAATEFVLSDLLIKEVGAPLVFSPDTFRGTFWQMPNGNQIPTHSGLDVSYDIYKPNVSTLSYPQYSGQLKMDADGKIYMGNIFKNFGVWKQINNS